MYSDIFLVNGDRWRFFPHWGFFRLHASLLIFYFLSRSTCHFFYSPRSSLSRGGVLCSSVWRIQNSLFRACVLKCSIRTANIHGGHIVHNYVKSLNACLAKHVYKLLAWVCSGASLIIIEIFLMRLRHRCGFTSRLVGNYLKIHVLRAVIYYIRRVKALPSREVETDSDKVEYRGHCVRPSRPPVLV